MRSLLKSDVLASAFSLAVMQVVLIASSQMLHAENVKSQREFIAYTCNITYRTGSPFFLQERASRRELLLLDLSKSRWALLGGANVSNVGYAAFGGFSPKISDTNIFKIELENEKPDSGDNGLGTHYTPQSYRFKSDGNLSRLDGSFVDQCQRWSQIEDLFRRMGGVPAIPSKPVSERERVSEILIGIVIFLSFLAAGLFYWRFGRGARPLKH